MKSTLSILFLIGIMISSIFMMGSIGGRTGRTLKSSTQGCGSCHGSSSTSGVSVVINGPSTLNTGQTAQYSLTITRATKTGAGLDIAVRRGTLSPVSTNIHLSNSELTHNDNITMTSGTMTVSFNYTASATAGIDTIWSTGIATNSSGDENGDEWNWATSKRVTVISPFTLNLTGIVEGFWNGATMVSDTVKTYLHNSVSPYAKVDSGKTFLNTLGIGSTIFSNAPGGTYYIDVTHRNAIQTWSALPQTFTAGGSTNYNFTTAATQAFGSNMIFKLGKYVFYSGDPNLDGSIDLSDIILIFNDANNFVSGYERTDLNGDSYIDLSDIVIAFNNSMNFVSVITP